jgi:hypothetical protein
MKHGQVWALGGGLTLERASALAAAVTASGHSGLASLTQPLIRPLLEALAGSDGTQAAPTPPPRKRRRGTKGKKETEDVNGM